MSSVTDSISVYAPRGIVAGSVTATSLPVAALRVALDAPSPAKLHAHLAIEPPSTSKLLVPDAETVSGAGLGVPVGEKSLTKVLLPSGVLAGGAHSARAEGAA